MHEALQTLFDQREAERHGELLGNFIVRALRFLKNIEFAAVQHELVRALDEKIVALTAGAEILRVVTDDERIFRIRLRGAGGARRFRSRPVIILAVKRHPRKAGMRESEGERALAAVMSGGGVDFRLRGIAQRFFDRNAVIAPEDHVVAIDV